MVSTLLMASLLETVIGAVTIMRHAARPVNADQTDQRVGAALGVDGITGGPVITDPGVEPDGVASQPPTRFIGGNVFGPLDLLLNFDEGRFQFLGRPQNNLGTAAGRDLQAMQLVHDVADLAVG